MSRIAYFDKELQQLLPCLPLCLLLLLRVPRSCPLAFHTFAYHLRGRLGRGWQQGVGCCCCCLSQPTLARVFLATCSSSSSSRSSGRSRSRSRFRCQGTTRLLEEVASCRRRRERGVWQKALNDFVSFFAFPCALLSPPFLVCGLLPPPHPP